MREADESDEYSWLERGIKKTWSNIRLYSRSWGYIRYLEYVRLDDEY